METTLLTDTCDTVVNSWCDIDLHVDLSDISCLI